MLQWSFNKGMVDVTHSVPAHMNPKNAQLTIFPLTCAVLWVVYCIFSVCIYVRELKSCFSSVYHKEACDTYRLRSLESLLCTCISCNYNLAGKHIHSHGFRVPEQNNKLAAITHICGSAWLNPCRTVSSSRGGHFPGPLLIHNKWPLSGFTLDCLAAISCPPCCCLSINTVKLLDEFRKALSFQRVSSTPVTFQLLSSLSSLISSRLPDTRWFTGLGLGWLCGGGALSRLNHLALSLELCSN